MATIDYKQKIKDYMNSSEVDTLYKSMLNNLFPELAESEDEKIRKDIIVLVKDWWDRVNKDNISTKEQMIAWLNKQGKIVDYYEDRLDECACKYFNKWYKQALEKQGKQKPAEEYNIAGISSNKSQGKLGEIIKNLKTTWSEKDEVGLANAMWAIEQARTIAKDENDMGNLWYAERWLKSLRPQSTWKPSEGQLECLGYAIEKAEKDWSPLANNRIYLTLKALKEQLEKL